ncbi:MAG: hypothetical protein JST54_23725 [Deltaproteobacteria bacterium]|nr:hypothetical protein [Deltaproteobacteria bacterium]
MTVAATHDDDKPISNFTVRMVLETLHELDPREADNLVRQAGLERMLTAPHGDQDPPILRTSELAKLYATVFKLTGETLTRVFLSNYGHKMAPMLLKHPEMVKRAEDAKSVPADKRIGWAVREIQAFLSGIWADVSLREDGEAYYLEIEHCPICANIQGTRGPICASSEFLYTALARALIGQRVSFIEHACRANGAAMCSYRLRK